MITIKHISMEKKNWEMQTENKLLLLEAPTKVPLQGETKLLMENLECRTSILRRSGIPDGPRSRMSCITAENTHIHTVDEKAVSNGLFVNGVYVCSAMMQDILDHSPSDT